MSSSITVEVQDGIIHSVYTGSLAAPELHKATHDILTLMLTEKIDRVLLDCSEAHMEVPAVDVYQLPDIYASRGISRRQVRAAVVTPKDGYKRDLYEFYEDVCRNRGYFVKIFDDVDTALAWLKAETMQD